MADKNFLTEIIDADLAEGKVSEIHTRFPPEPNGYLHIGSAKAIYINWSIANQYGGKFNLRLDDTNPAREGEEYVNSIIEDLHWLGADPNGGIFYGSDYFDKCYEYAEKLILEGKAYVDDLTRDEMREYRGSDAGKPSRPSPWRDRTPEENLDLFRRMRAGEFKEGEKHGIEFFKACLSALQLNGLSCHVMFMPCSTEAKYFRRFRHLHEYIVTSRPELTSGLHDVDVFEDRESLHNAKGSENRVLERNYRITGNLEGKQIVIVDDVLTTGQSMADYKGEIERCGGKVVAAVFYGKTVTMSPPFLVKVYVWGSYITDLIGELAKPSDKKG